MEQDGDSLGLTTDAWRSHRNPAGILFGALVTGAVIAVSSAATDKARTIMLAVIQVLIVYWATHVYTRVIADRLTDPSATFLERSKESLQHELSVLLGGVPALGVFALAVAAGASTSRAANLALAATVVLFATAGYAVGRQAKATGWNLIGEVGAAVVLGVVIVVLKAAGIH
jgi:hypothetical protein